MKRFSLLFTLLLVATVTFSQSAKEYTQKGRELYEKREFMEALLNLNKALEIDPNYAQAYFVRANIKDAFDDRIFVCLKELFRFAAIEICVNVILIEGDR